MTAISASTRATHVACIRSFDRLYTQRIRALGEHTRNSALSLPEARILFELAQRASASGADLARSLDLDPGYVSRILARLRRTELLIRAPAPSDGRRREYTLSAQGERTFGELTQASRAQICALLDELSPAAERALVHAARVLQRTLGGDVQAAAPIVLREPKPGDMGWIIERHAQLYHTEYGWDARFEALCARIAAEFIDQFDPATERGWIADSGEQRLGSALVVKAGAGSAKIRLVLVEPEARGSGLGRRLIRECIRFARRKNYQRITLWTNDNLSAARHIYATEGFALLSSEPHHSFGHDLVGENWQLSLT